MEKCRHIWRSARSLCIKQGGGAALSVALCVALLDMMRDDIMVDAAAASSEMWKAPICLTLAESNVSICHSPRDRTLVFIKINILCHSKDLFFSPSLFIYLSIYSSFHPPKQVVMIVCACTVTALASGWGRRQRPDPSSAHLPLCLGSKKTNRQNRISARVMQHKYF